MFKMICEKMNKISSSKIDISKISYNQISNWEHKVSFLFEGIYRHASPFFLHFSKQNLPQIIPFQPQLLNQSNQLPSILRVRSISRLLKSISPFLIIFAGLQMLIAFAL